MYIRYGKLSVQNECSEYCINFVVTGSRMLNVYVQYNKLGKNLTGEDI